MPFELFASRREGRIWTLLREDGEPVELRVEKPGARVGAGRVLRARVNTVHVGMQAAFLDIGDDHAGFLPAAELKIPGVPPAARSAPMQDRLKAGRDLVVQVTREALGGKGARLTTAIGIPGRLLVYYPGQRFRRVSRRIHESERREALLTWLRAIPGDDGFIARTAARDAGADAVTAEAEKLRRAWAGLDSGSGPPRVLWREPALTVRILRDLPAASTGRIVLDDRELYDVVRSWLELHAPELLPRLEPCAEPQGAFAREGLWEVVEGCLRPEVQLESGGSLIIEEAESMVVVDVNTARDRGGRDLEATALRCNLQAARELARQLRLRDLGGVVVVDFIEMESPEHRRRVVAELETALEADPSRTRVLGMSELGLVELARQRSRPGPARTVTRPCERCDGRGRVADGHSAD